MKQWTEHGEDQGSVVCVLSNDATLANELMPLLTPTEIDIMGLLGKLMFA